MSTKVCSKCNVEFDLENFYKSSAQCKGCHKSRYTPEERKYQNIWYKYRLKPDQYDEMTKNGCYVCGTFDRLCVDHDHTCCPGKKTCGKCVRGILCFTHNVQDESFTSEQLRNAKRKLYNAKVRVAKAQARLREAEIKLEADTREVNALLDYRNRV